MNFLRLLVFFLLFILYSFSPIKNKPVCGNKDFVKITFTGDIMMHYAVKASASEHNQFDEKKKTTNNSGFDFLFEKIKSHFLSSDIVFGNMEFPVSPPYFSKGFIFNCTPDVIPAMKKAGYNLLTIANNHIYDHSRKGVVDTIKYLEKYNFDFLGVKSTEDETRAGIVKEINGIRIGFLAYTGILNYPFPSKPRGFYINQFYNEKKVKQDILKLRAKCDYLILTVHTGEEYKVIPQKRDQILMKRYLEDGVDLIIGHHPHVLQYIEKYLTKDKRSCYIFYSLGNFISNQKFSYDMQNKKGKFSTQDSILVNLFLNRDGKKIDQKFEVLPIWTENSTIIIKNKYYRNIQTRYIKDFIDELSQKLIDADPTVKKVINKRIQELNYRVDIMRRLLFFKQNIEEVKIIY